MHRQSPTSYMAQHTALTNIGHTAAHVRPSAVLKCSRSQRARPGRAAHTFEGHPTNMEQYCIFARLTAPLKDP